MMKALLKHRASYLDVFCIILIVDLTKFSFWWIFLSLPLIIIVSVLEIIYL